MPVQPSFFGENNEYADILRFLKEHSYMTYNKFDNFALREVNLFDVPKDDSFRVVEETLDNIIAALPAIKRIFARPIVHLKDTQEIVPVEAVRVINNYTLSHAALHSELWADLGREGMKPKKLMTIEKVENYVIYENIVFTRAVNLILAFVKRTVIMLKDILYGCQDLHFNLLDRTHHSSYFLAIGKLHMEYARAQRRHNQAYARCIEKLFFVEKTIRSKLRSPVYVKCNKNKQKITLKKTNTFRSHKDYKEIYRLIKSFDVELDVTEIESTDDGAEHDEYRAYCLFLTVFAVGHFNFTYPDSRLLNFNELKSKFTFLDWSLTLRSVKNRKVDGLCLEFKKDVDYTICMVFCDKEEITPKGFEAFKKSAKADEYWFVSPHTFGASDVLYLSIYDVDSFRRVQQLVLRGMIYSDTKGTVCPFCGNPTVSREDGYDCGVCRAEVTREVCKKTGKTYFTSKIRKYKSAIEGTHAHAERTRFLHDRFSEARLHFRNITPLSRDGAPICPHCGEVHE